MGFWQYMAERLEAARLRKENADLQYTNELWEDKLFAEIDSSRRREGDLVDAVLEAAGLNTRVNVRTEITQDATKPVDGGDVDEDFPTDAQVKEVAGQFIADAAQRGIEYDEAARGLLIEAIKANPAEYFS